MFFQLSFVNSWDVADRKTHWSIFFVIHTHPLIQYIDF